MVVRGWREQGRRVVNYQFQITNIKWAARILVNPYFPCFQGHYHSVQEGYNLSPPMQSFDI